MQIDLPGVEDAWIARWDFWFGEVRNLVQFFDARRDRDPRDLLVTFAEDLVDRLGPGLTVGRGV